MLAPNTRLMLLDALRPPGGFEVDAAIGTTYTLSLDALLIAPAAWAMHTVSDRLDAVDPILLANTLRQFASRTMVFHQAGSAAPFTSGGDELAAFLDEMAFPVRVEQGSTFHPKIWVLRFRSAAGEVGYRLLIGSRNLSLDSTWDVLVRLDSARPGDGSVPATAIAGLLRSLPARTTVSVPFARLALLESVAVELDRVTFVPPDGCDSAEILWWTRKDSPASLFPTRCDRRLVISPFLGAGGIGRVPATRSDGRSVLISRATSLTPELAAGFEPFTLTTDASDIEAGEEARRGSELHAKVYAFDDGDRATVILGSANATGAAFSFNDEVVVRLQGGLEALGVLQLLGEPAEDVDAREELELADLLVEWYAVDGEEGADQADEGRFFEEIIRSVAAGGVRGECVHLGEDRWALTLELVAPVSVPRGIDVEFRLLSLATAMPPDFILGMPVRLEVELAQITRFVVARFIDSTGRTEAESVVLVADFEPPDGRHLRALRALLTDRDRFVRFLRYLLDSAHLELDPFADLDDDLWAQHRRRRGSYGRSLGDGPILEQLLRLLARDPGELRHLDAVISEFSHDETILPGDFVPLWEAIAPLIPKVDHDELG